MEQEEEYRVIRTKYKTWCRHCYEKIDKGEQVKWFINKKTVRHVWDCKKGVRPHTRVKGGRVRFVTGRGC